MPPGPGGVDIATLGLILDGRQMRAESVRVTSSLATMRKAGTSATKTMLRLAGALAALAAFRAATRAAGEFEGALQRSIAIMGDVDDFMRTRLSEAARQVGIDFNIGATAAAESFFFLASAGLTAEQSLASLVPVATFAKAGMFDMALATDLATDAQSALGLRTGRTAQDIENLVRVTDVLVKANTIANATVEQFATSITTEAGAALKIFNKDIEEGVAVLAVFADQGIKGQVAGSALARVIRIMTAAAVNNKDAYEDLGIQIFDTTTKAMLPMADIVEDLENALGDMGDETRVAALQQLGFTARIQGVINPLIGASEQIRVYERALRSAGGITQEVAAKQLQAPMERAGIAIKTFGDAGITAGQNILKFLVPALEFLAEHSGLVIDLLLSLAVALAAIQIGIFIPKVIALAVAFGTWASSLIFTTTAAVSLSAALLNLQIALGPAGLLLLGVAALTAAFFVWRRSQRASEAAAESLRQEMIKDTEQVQKATDAQLQLGKAQAQRVIQQAILARSQGTITPEQEELEEKFLNILRATTKEIADRAATAAQARVEAANEAAEAADALAIRSAATRQAEIELERQVALNEAFGQSSFALQRINTAFDLQTDLIENATEAKGEDLEALNLQTRALNEQKLIAIELAEAQQRTRREAGQERGIDRQRAVNAAIGEGTFARNLLNNELDRAAQLSQNLESFQGAELARAQELTEQLFDERRAFIELNEEREQTLLGGDRARQIERQQALNAAVGEGAVAQALLHVELQRADDLFRVRQVQTGKELINTEAFINAMADLRVKFIQANDEIEKGTKLPELYEAAARGIQQALSSGFQDVIENGIQGFEDMANRILDIFSNLATEIAGALAADALGLDDLVATLREGGELSRSQELLGAAGIGTVIGGAVGGGGAGSQIGGGIGGAAGFAIGGPVGGAIGSALGGFVGGLFGSNDEARKAQEEFAQTIDEYIRTMQLPSIGDPSFDLRNQLLDLVRGFEDAFEETVEITQAQADAFNASGLARRFGLTQVALINADTDLDDFIRNLETVGQQFEAGSAEAIEFEQVLEASRLAIENLRKAQARLTADFETDLRVREATLRGDDQAAISARLTNQQEKELEVARELLDQGLITQDMFSRLARVLDEELANAIMGVEGSIGSLLTSLMDFQQELTFGPGSTLAPVQQLDEARRQFEETRTAALGGDAAAAAALPEVSQRLLDISRQVNASGQGFVQDFQRVQMTVDTVIAQFGEQMSIEERQVAAAESSLQTMTEALAESQETNRILVQGFQDLGSQVEGVMTATQENTDAVESGGEVLI